MLGYARVNRTPDRGSIVPHKPVVSSLDRTTSPTEIRSAFPALQRRQGDREVAYFDGPGGTQVPRPVADAVTRYLLAHNANTHWEYPTSRETDALLAESRAALGDLFGAGPGEVAFGANMTTLTFHVARAIGRDLEPGATIVVTELDHHANVAPWRAIARERGLRIRTVRLDPGTGRLDGDDLAAAIAEGPAVVAIGAASNVLGTVNDVAPIAASARAQGALVYVDAVHYAAHGPMDVEAWGCDFVACSAYKFYGPHVGVLWGRHELLDRLDFPRLDPAPQEAPDRAETGTQNHEGIVGARAAVDFLAGICGTRDENATATRRTRLLASLQELEVRSDALATRLREGLAGLAGVRLHGPSDGPRTPTVSFTLDGVDATSAARTLAGEHALFLSHGDFYAPTVIERYGSPPGGFLRAGCACYTTASEIDRLLEAIGELIA